MSLGSKLFLASGIVFGGYAIYWVHHTQKEELKDLRKGIILDIARQAKKKQEEEEQLAAHFERVAQKKKEEGSFEQSSTTSAPPVSIEDLYSRRSV